MIHPKGEFHWLYNQAFEMIGFCPAGKGTMHLRFDWQHRILNSLKRGAFNLALGVGMFAYMSLIVSHDRWRPAFEEWKADIAAQHEQDRLNQLKSDQIAYLNLAAYRGDIDRIKSLIADGADVNGVGERLVTPLISAASGCQLSIVKFLLKHGADPHAETDEGFSAYDFAIFNHDITVAKLVRIGRPARPMGQPANLSVQISELSPERGQRSQ